MPIESISRIMSRIKHAPRTQPISVFVVTETVGEKSYRKLDAIYGRTIEAKRRQTALKPFHPSHRCKECGHIETFLAEEWLGDFDNTMHLPDVRTFLETATES